MTIIERAAGAAAAAASRLTDRTAILIVLVLGVVLAAPGMALTADANPDGLFYEAQTRQLQGDSRDDALAAVFGGGRAHALAATSSTPESGRRLLDARWEHYSARFYQRRWLVPAMALGLSQVSGLEVSRSVQIVSMLGYALLGLALYGLLRRRFSPPVALATAAIAFLAPPLYRWSFGQFVDSWGVVLEVCGLLGLLLVADRGLRWLWVWVGAMLLLSITRDATMILGIAAVAVALAQRRDPAARRRNAWLLGTGAAAAVPALLLGGAPVRENLAYIETGYNVPADDSWSFALSHYLPQLRGTVDGNFTYPSTLGILGPAFAVFLVITIALLAAALSRRPRGDAFWAATWGTAIGCVLLVLLAANPQGYRLELVFAPVVGAGLARLLAALTPRLAAWTSPSRRPVGTAVG
jgi:hypothetical protein